MENFKKYLLKDFAYFLKYKKTLRAVETVKAMKTMKLQRIEDFKWCALLFYLKNYFLLQKAQNKRIEKLRKFGLL